MTASDQSPTLVVLAAGIGARFGGLKPAAAVGPHGEALLSVSLQQAGAAGFDRAVVVVSESTQAAIAAIVASSGLSVSLRRQRVPDGRNKPLGTLDAALSSEVTGDAVVINGDDLYGVAGLAVARDWFADRTTSATPADAAAVLYRIENTLPAQARVGSGVSRALAELDDEGGLLGLRECRDVHRDPAGIIRTGDGSTLAEGTLVSLNLWCLRPPAITAFREQRNRVMADERPDSDRELGLPQTIDALIANGQVSVAALVTSSRWLGVTWADDVSTVRAALDSANG